MELPDDLPLEHRTAVRAYLAARWWPMAELLATADRCYPGRLPELLPALLAGEPVAEPFETWS